MSEAARRTIPIRRPVFSLKPRAALDDAPGPSRHWYGGDPFATRFLDALSSTFPIGEAFFVRAVMRYRDRVTDPALLDRIRGFAGQEAQHSRLHDEHLALLLAEGHPVIAFRNRMIDRILRFQNRNAPKLSLATTAALEHLTAILARQMLEDDAKRTVPMDPAIAPLWRWHALEESEHKAVAYDVLATVAPGRGHRIAGMALATFFLAFESLLRTAVMLRTDGLLFDRRTWSQGLRFLFGADGLLRGTGPAYRAWYARDFHPDDVDDEALVAHFAPRVAREIAG
jgi:predicted metal-dependent hydrolase